MLIRVAEALDEWIAVQNKSLRAEGLPLLKPCKLKVIGQTALLETGFPLRLASTLGVDIRADLDFAVQKQLQSLLSERDRTLDPLAHEAWMPRETRYKKIFEGQFVQLLIADAEAVLLSKALKAPAKNRVLLTEYLAHGPSERFLNLAQKYNLDLEQLL